MKKTTINIQGIVLLAVSLILTGCEKNKKMLPVDGDGNYYDTVVIGTQTWLKENLKTTKYINGDPITLVTDNDKWTTFDRGAYCWYDNDIEYKNIYGALYNWNAAKTSEFLCPVGYHVPTVEDWKTLINYLGGEEEAEYRLKEAGLEHWKHYDRGSNSSGFTGLPGGIRDYRYGTFKVMGEYGIFWSSDDCRAILLGPSDLQLQPRDARYGFSVRCVKNN